MSPEDFFLGPTKTYHHEPYALIDAKRPELSTKGRTAVVTGAGQNIGAAISHALAKSGISALALIGRTESKLLATKASIAEAAPDTKVFTYALDIVDGAAVEAAFESFVAQAGAKIDILVANAGYLAPLTSIADADPASWWAGFEINIKGNFNLLRAYVPRSADGGAVVHLSTAAIYIPYLPGYSSYRGSKSGATKVFENFWKEMGELGRGIRTVQIHPGLILSPMTESFKDNPFGIPFDSVDLSANFLLWAVSDQAAFLDGRLVQANWDVEELVGMKERFEKDQTLFTMVLNGL